MEKERKKERERERERVFVFLSLCCVVREDEGLFFNQRRRTDEGLEMNECRLFCPEIVWNEASPH